MPQQPLPFRGGSRGPLPRRPLLSSPEELTDFMPRIDKLPDPEHSADLGRPARSGPPSGRRPSRPAAHAGRSAPSGSVRPATAKPRGRGFGVVRTIGELCLTAGVVVLLFMFYEVYVTNLFAAHKQSEATNALNQEWANQRANHYDLTDGHGIAKMYVPALGADYQFTIVYGVTQADLAIGPGYNPGTALPGQPGNFAVSGHRVGQDAPFNDIDLMQSCDAIIVETQSDWYVYRVLPMKNERANWASTRGQLPRCSGQNGESKVQPLVGEYSQTDGQEVVLPNEGDVIAPIPHYPYTTLSDGQELKLMTLTTCTPKFDASHRLILHAILVRDWKKDPSKPNQAPPEMAETS